MDFNSFFILFEMRHGVVEENMIIVDVTKEAKKDLSDTIHT